MRTKPRLHSSIIALIQTSTFSTREYLRLVFRVLGDANAATERYAELICVFFLKIKIKIDILVNTAASSQQHLGEDQLGVFHL